MTDWLAAEARTPPAQEWHRASHALVSLAKRAPDKVPVVLMAHVSHHTWQVRMYAARAASATNNVPALERLSLDEHPNVREATLAALRQHKGADADPAFVSALGMSDYQLLRTAATELKGASTNSALVTALVEALRRVTSEQRDTSRDPRLALLDRIAELGSADDAGRLVPLLRDFDIRVATAAGAVLQQWTGTPQEVAPVLLSRPPLPLDVELKELREVPARVEMASGKVFDIALDPDTAPLASVRFHRLVKAGYYTGLTWHRTVPNFVLQGGSPGANEYVGDGPYLRDELDTAANVRGSVGLSTRGRDTGDAQIYFNLVDNARLDYDYTVVGTVGGTGMDVVDRIVEGDRIKAITFDRKKE